MLYEFKKYVNHISNNIIHCTINSKNKGMRKIIIQIYEYVRVS